MSALSCVFGFLLPMRRLRDRIASLEPTVFERMTSEISRLTAISSLVIMSNRKMVLEERQAHSELDVARSICSSSWEEDANQPAIILDCATPKCCRFCL